MNYYFITIIIGTIGTHFTLKMLVYFLMEYITYFLIIEIFTIYIETLLSR